MGFTIAVGQGFAGDTVDRWRVDPELRSAMAYAELGPHYLPGAKMFFRVARLGDLVMSATVASSPLVYETIPMQSRRDPARHFHLFMPNQPRTVTLGERRFIQQAGECVLADSGLRVVGEYASAHAGVCLSIPFALVERHLQVAEDLDCIRFGTGRVLSRLVSRLMLCIWNAVEAGKGAADGGDAAHALLRLIGYAYAGSASRPGADAARKLTCEQVKELIGAELSNPALSVQGVAAATGVTTRYLQLLFAEEGECVSEYIRRERLRACLLDLRRADYGDRSITDIAFSWGFNSAAHFSSVFRKEFGISPRDYRHCDLSQLAAELGDEAEGPVLEALHLVSRRPAQARAVLAA